MNKNIAIGVGVVVLILAVFLGYKLVNKNKINKLDTISVAQNMVAVTGKVTNTYEVGNDLNYIFDIPETSTSTVSEEGDLIKIGDGMTNHSTVYFSYEGEKALSALDYITEIIAPHVSVIDITDTTTVGNYEWQLAETAGSDWYIASVNGGKWIVAIESRKIYADEAKKLVTSFKVQ